MTSPESRSCAVRCRGPRASRKGMQAEGEADPEQQGPDQRLRHSGGGEVRVLPDRDAEGALAGGGAAIADKQRVKAAAARGGCGKRASRGRA